MIWTLPRSLPSSLLIGLLAASPAAAAEVDSSTLLSREQSKEWRGVGRVNIAGTNRRSMCTGTLIAPDLVLTAAHCLTNPRTGLPHLTGNVHFVAGWHKGESTGYSKAAALAIHPGWEGRRATRLSDLETDVALIRLRDPLGPEAAAPFTFSHPPLPGETLTLISYRRDRAHALTRQDDCPYRAIIGRILELQCTVTFGASGSPIFLHKDGVKTVVAVLSAMGDRDSPTAFAVRVDEVIEGLIGQLR